MFSLENIEKLIRLLTSSTKKSKLKIEYVPICKLKGWKDNPRYITDQQSEALGKSMEKFGIVDPIIINLSNTVIGGHQRLVKAEEQDIKEVPVVKIDVKGKDFKALNIALNKISGEWDTEKLTPILEELKEFPQIELTGFDEKELTNLLGGVNFEPRGPENQGQLDKISKLDAECPKCGHQFQIDRTY